VGGHGHDRAGAIAHHHVVGDPDRDALVVDRVDGIAAGEDAGLLLVGRAALDFVHACGLRLVRLDLGRCASVVTASTSGCSGASTMKVAPHSVSGRVVKMTSGSPCSVWKATSAPMLRPIQLVCITLTRSGHSIVLQHIEQFVGIARDAELPLLQVLLDHRRAAAFAVAVVAPDLLARQGGVAVRAEIDRRVLAIGNAGVVELAEEPLRPLVIVRVAAYRFVLPRPHCAHAPQLAAHPLDVGDRSTLGWMRTVLDGRVFGGQPEGVEADGKKTL
jgi:hypothetical protein